MSHARAILWAQWRTFRNFYPRAGMAWTVAVGTIWYGVWILAAVATTRLLSNPANLGIVKTALPGGLLLLFLYWQVVPLLMAATGASLELRKLQAYPIPVAQLFGIEVMLRVTAGIEMVLILVGLGIGVLRQPSCRPGVRLRSCRMGSSTCSSRSAFAICWCILAQKRIREIAFLLLVICAGLPQLLLTRGPASSVAIGALFARETWAGWPWTAVANLLQGRQPIPSWAVILAWTAAAAIFGRWQFGCTLRFDADAAAASHGGPLERGGPLETFYRLPSSLFADPLAVLIEKEIRSLLRSPRFRLVFLMGFTFGLVIGSPWPWAGIRLDLSWAIELSYGGERLLAAAVKRSLFLELSDSIAPLRRFTFLRPSPFPRC